jgi:hypothetical protein
MEEGESLAGYIRRFHAANGHKVPRDLYNALRALYRGTKSVAVAAFDLVQATFGDTVALDRSWWLGRHLHEGCLGGGSHPPAYITFQLHPLRLCPACLQDGGIHVALWEMPLIEACPLHHCALLTACTACSRTLEWQNCLPDWHCQCGMSIPAMPSATPNAGALELARVLTGSSDLALPKAYRAHFTAPDGLQYRLDEVYKGLEWGTELRELLSGRGSLAGEPKAKPRPKKERRARWGAWERRLIGDSSDELIARLVRAQRKYFNSPLPLGYVFPHDSLARAKAFVREAAPCVVQTKIQKTLDRYLTDYALDLPLSLFVWFADARHSKKRVAEMRQFARWWAVLAARMGDLDPTMQRLEETLAQRVRTQDVSLHEVHIVDVLNLLFEAARKRLDADSFRAFTYWWRIPPTLREVRDPEELFRRIGLHLASIREEEILFVLALVQRAHKGE